MEKIKKPTNTGGSWGLTDYVTAEWIRRVIPASVFDLGCGLGKYEEMIRKDRGLGVKIDGIDIFKKSVDWLKSARNYNKVFHGDIRYFEYEKYDLGIAGDVLEHLELHEVEDLLRKFYKEKTFKYLIVVLPLGERPQEACGGNEAEKHLCVIHESWFIQLCEKIGYNITDRYVATAISETGKYPKMAMMLKR